MHTFSVQAMLRVYHVYKSIWDNACDDDILLCKREVGYPHNPSTVVVTKVFQQACHVELLSQALYWVIKKAKFWLG